MLQPECSTIVRVLEESVRRNISAGLLLSGGLDTSILAALAARWQKPYCITVALRGAPAPDIEYAVKVARLFNLDHYIHYFGDEELEEGIRQTVKALRTFDPMEVRNSAAAYIGLKAAAGRGLPTVMTGDGADELLAGYSFFFDMEKAQLETALHNMCTGMNFSSIPLAEALGIEVRLPFLDPEFKALAMGLDSSLKVNRNGKQAWGKWILRQAFESLLSPEIAWRTKAPLEEGTGTATLPALFDARIDDSEFDRKKQIYLHEDKVIIRSKEHLVYYEIYRDVIGVPGLAPNSGRKCPDCGTGVKEHASFCRTCGAYPI